MDKKLFPELGLAPEVLQAVTALGFEQPSPIQAHAIPPALEGRDVVGQSQTGSGKTMAFAIPAVQLLDPRERGVKVLIMCPTRELAMQVCEEVSKIISCKPGLKALPIYGGATFSRQIRGLQDGAQVVVGTPGRILDFIERGVLKLDGLKMLVFDEADEMLDMGFREDIEKLVHLVPPTRQTLFFSATLAGPIRKLVESFTKDPVIVTIEHKALTVPTIEQRFYEVNSRSKMEVLCRILDIENPRLAIVFGNTKRIVDDITDVLMGRGYAVDRLHGDLNQTMRDRVMKNFRAGNVEILAATDVAARGLDVDDIDLVVNFDLPYDEEDYVHRIGRTGRAGRSGKAVSLVSGRDIFLLQRIQRYANVKIERHKVPTREEVEGKRVDTHFSKLQSLLEEGGFTSQETTLQRLLDAGHSSTDIASALIHLLLGDDARESQEILEDRPRQDRNSRPRQEFTPRDQMPQQGSDNREARPPRPQREPRVGGPGPGNGAYTRLFINIGAIDEVTPREISGAIYRTANLPQGSLGKIEIFSKCSYVGVPPEHVQQVLSGIEGSTLRGRALRMDIADQQEFREARPQFDRPHSPRPNFDAGNEGGGGGQSRPPYGGGGGGGNRSGGAGGGFRKFGGFKKPRTPVDNWDD